jgi:hypothetical protein
MNNVIWLLASQIIDPMLRSTMKILSKFSVFSLLWIVLLYTRQVLSDRNTTCDALTALARRARTLSHIGMSETCNTTANCLGIQCVTSPPPSLYASMTLLPCSDPIAMRMIITYGGRLIFDRNITQSTTESATIPILNLNFPVFLDITYQPGNGSVTLGVSHCVSTLCIVHMPMYLVL